MEKPLQDYVKLRYLKYRDGEVVVEEGSDSEDVYFIVSGRAEVSQSIDGRRVIVSILHKGDYIAEEAALGDAIRSTTVKAVGELHLYQLSFDDMLTYMQTRYPQEKTESLSDAWAGLTKRLRDNQPEMRDFASGTIAGSRNENEEVRITDIFCLDKINVLVVYDNENALAALKDLLSDEYNVFTTTDGQSALRLMEHNSIVVVISKYRMPGMSGMELLERVGLEYPNTVRIILSNYFDRMSIMRSTDAVNIHEVLLESWRGEEIKFTVATWIEQYRKANQLEERAEQCRNSQRKLEAANDLTLKLMRDLASIRELKHNRIPFWQRCFGLKARQRENAEGALIDSQGL